MSDSQLPTTPDVDDDLERARLDAEQYRHDRGRGDYAEEGDVA